MYALSQPTWITYTIALCPSIDDAAAYFALALSQYHGSNRRSLGCCHQFQQDCGLQIRPNAGTYSEVPGTARPALPLQSCAMLINMAIASLVSIFFSCAGRTFKTLNIFSYHRETPRRRVMHCGRCRFSVHGPGGSLHEVASLHYV